MANDAPVWFRSAIGSGLQGLIALRLQGAPSYDTVRLTADAWAATLWPARAWVEELDSRRIESAFLVLARRVDHWPVPKQLLSALPPRAEPAALPPPTVDRTRARENVKRLKRLLKGAYRKPE